MNKTFKKENSLFTPFHTMESICQDANIETTPYTVIEKNRTPTWHHFRIYITTRLVQIHARIERETGSAYHPPPPLKNHKNKGTFLAILVRISWKITTLPTGQPWWSALSGFCIPSCTIKMLFKSVCWNFNTFFRIILNYQKLG